MLLAVADGWRVYRPRPNLEREKSSHKPLFYDLDCFRGVVGRLLPPKPWTYFCFFSAGLRIWTGVVSWYDKILKRGGDTNLEGAEQTFIHAHHGTSVVELAAVVGGAEQRDELALRKELVAILDDLVGTADQVHVVFLEEARDDVWTERERDTAVVLGPTGNILVGVGPQQIAEKAAVGDLERKRQ